LKKLGCVNEIQIRVFADIPLHFVTVADNQAYSIILFCDIIVIIMYNVINIII